MTPLKRLHHVTFILGLFLAPGVLIWIMEAI
ncbi:hypothetical protein LCGC14_1929640 [marine sediment metagenome]|uniref:Uncharacterized protein n=1 Tax=marine sediment metagenome TaxID=412755 RepID=A0A0F9I2A2_9ZZZZ